MRGSEREAAQARYRGRKRYNGTTAHIGMPGSGKTYALVKTAVEANQRGRCIWANMGFELKFERVGCEHGEVHYYRSFLEMLTVPSGAIVLLDEAPTYFNARRWQEFPSGLLYRFTQIRKDGLELHYSAIHEDFIDKVLRQMTFNVWHWKALSGRLLLGRLYAMQEFRRRDARARRREWVWVRPRIASCYDTEGKVAIAVSVLEEMLSTSAEEWIAFEAGVPLELLLERAGLDRDALKQPGGPARRNRASGRLSRSPAADGQRERNGGPPLAGSIARVPVGDEDGREAATSGSARCETCGEIVKRPWAALHRCPAAG